MGRPAVARAETSKELCIEAATAEQRSRDEGHWLEAKERFLTCAAATCPGLVRSECARWLSDVEAQLPSVVLGARSATGADLNAVRVTLDGHPFMTELDGRPRPLDPGAHRLRFEAAGHRPGTVDVVVRAGESARVIVVTLEREQAAGMGTPPGNGPHASLPTPHSPEEPAAPSAAPLWILSGLALASAGAATALLVYAHEENDGLASGCSPRCSDGDTRPLRTSLAFANVAVAATLLSLGGLTYFVVKRSAAGPSPQPAATLAVVPMASWGAGGAFAILRY